MITLIKPFYCTHTASQKHTASIGVLQLSTLLAIHDYMKKLIKPFSCAYCRQIIECKQRTTMYIRHDYIIISTVHKDISIKWPKRSNNWERVIWYELCKIWSKIHGLWKWNLSSNLWSRIGLCFMVHFVMLSQSICRPDDFPADVAGNGNAYNVFGFNVIFYMASETLFSTDIAFMCFLTSGGN